MDELIRHSPYFIAPHQRAWLLNAFWILSLSFVALLFTLGDSLQSILAAVLISIAALIPVYAWCAGWVVGLPIFPLLSLSFLWSHALPLVLSHRDILLHLPEKHLFAGVTVFAFLLFAGVIWLLIASRELAPPESYREINPLQVNTAFLLLLVLATLYQIALNANWIFLLPGGLIAIFRTVFIGLNLIGVFILSYRLGRRTLEPGQRVLFRALLCLYLASAAAGLILLYTLTTFLIAASGYVVGSRKLPWRTLLVVFVIVSALHLGKGEMRAKYWNHQREIFEEQQDKGLVYPWDLPGWYIEWIGYSLESFQKSEEPSYFIEDSEPQKTELLSILDRASVIHLLLRIQSVTPDPVPYLKGATYTIIPELLIPRVFHKHKISSHEGTHRLSIHYGLQTRSATRRTTIGWGLLNESYANFGFAGIAMLSLFLGIVIGAATLWSAYTPIFSARAMFAIVLMTLAVQRELTAGVFVSALFQSSIVLIAVCFLFMQRQERRTATVHE